MNTAEKLINKLYKYFSVSSQVELAKKLNVNRQNIYLWKKSNTIYPIERKCRELGIYDEIFGTFEIEKVNEDEIENIITKTIKSVTNKIKKESFSLYPNIPNKILYKLDELYKNGRRAKVKQIEDILDEAEYTTDQNSK